MLSNEVIISRITSRRDELKQKAAAVNNHLKVVCITNILNILTTRTSPVSLNQTLVVYISILKEQLQSENFIKHIQY